MPYAQVHYPFQEEARDSWEDRFPADFIAEGLDQTRFGIKMKPHCFTCFALHVSFSFSFGFDTGVGFIL
jgi:hypothetical protein